MKGKYDGPLHGYRPLDKLTRYIEKAMPDDDPGKVAGEEATAVARYIYDEVHAGLQANNGARLDSVKLWETDTCSATYRR